MANIRIALVDSLSKKFGADLVKQLQIVRPEIDAIVKGFGTIDKVLNATNSALGRIQTPKGLKDFSLEIEKQERLAAQLNTRLQSLNQSYAAGAISQQKYTEAVRGFKQVADAQNNSLNRLSKSILDSNVGAEKQAVLLARVSAASVKYGASFKQAEGNIKSLEKEQKKLAETQDKGQRSVHEYTKGIRDLGFAFGVLGTPVGRLVSSLTFLAASLGSLGVAGVGVLAVMAPLIAAFKAAEISTALFKKGLSAAFDVFAPFEQGIKNAASVMDGTQRTFDQLGAAARKTALDFRFSSKEISDGFVILGRAGFDAGESLATIRSTAELAQATFSSLADSTDLLTTTVRAFEEQSVTADRAAQVFAATTNKSKTSVESLRTSFNFVAVSAAQLGISIEDTSALLGILADRGLKASTQTTGLRGIIASLLAPTDKFHEALRRVGLTIEDIDPRLIGIEGTLRKLRDAGFDVESAYAGLDRRVAAAATALIAGADSFVQLRNEITGTRAATEIAAQQMTTLQAKLDIARNSLENLGISFGEQVEGALKDFLDKFIELSGEGKAIDQLVKKGAILFETIVNLGTAFLEWIDKQENLEIVLGVAETGFRLLATSIAIAAKSFHAFLKVNEVAAKGLGILPGLYELGESFEELGKRVDSVYKATSEYAKGTRFLLDILEESNDALRGRSKELEEESKALRASIGIRKALIFTLDQEFKLINSATASTDERSRAVQRLISVLSTNKDFQTVLNDANLEGNQILEDQVQALNDLRDAQQELVLEEEIDDFLVALTDIDTAFGGVTDKAEGLSERIVELGEKNRIFSKEGKEVRNELYALGTQMQETAFQAALQIQAFIDQSNGAIQFTDVLDKLIDVQLRVSDTDAAYIELVKQSVAALNGKKLGVAALNAEQERMFRQISAGNDEIANANIALESYRLEFELLTNAEKELLEQQSVFGDTIKKSNGEVVNLAAELDKVQTRLREIAPLLEQTGSSTKEQLAALTESFAEARREVDQTYQESLDALNLRFAEGRSRAGQYFSELTALNERHKTEEAQLDKERLVDLQEFWESRAAIARGYIQQTLEFENFTAEERKKRVQEQLEAFLEAKKEERKIILDLIELQKKEIEALKKGVEEVQDLAEDVGDTIEDAIRAVEDAIASLSDQEGGVEDFRKALIKLREETRDLESDTKAFEIALDVLNKQYANNTIGTDEYNHRLADLQKEYKSLEERGKDLGESSKDLADRVKNLKDEFGGQSSEAERAVRQLKDTKSALENTKEAQKGFNEAVGLSESKLAQATGELSKMEKASDRVSTEVKTLEDSFGGVIEKIKAVGVQFNEAAKGGLQDFLDTAANIDSVKEKVENLREAAQPIDLVINTNGKDEVDDLVNRIETAIDLTAEEHEFRVNVIVENEDLLDRLIKAAELGANIQSSQKAQGKQIGGIVEPVRMQRGGRVGAPGTFGGGDQVSALLEPGEYVLRKEASRRIGYNVLDLHNKKFDRYGSNRYQKMSAMALTKYLPMLRRATGGIVRDKDFLELARKLGLRLDSIPDNFARFASSLAQSNPLTNETSRILVDLLQANSKAEVRSVGIGANRTGNALPSIFSVGGNRSGGSGASSSGPIVVVGTVVGGLLKTLSGAGGGVGLSSRASSTGAQSKGGGEPREFPSWKDIVDRLKEAYENRYGDNDIGYLSSVTEGSTESVRQYWRSLLGDKGIDEYLKQMTQYETALRDLYQVYASDGLPVQGSGRPVPARILDGAKAVMGEWFFEAQKYIRENLGIAFPNIPPGDDSSSIARNIQQMETEFNRTVESLKEDFERRQRSETASFSTGSVGAFGGFSGAGKKEPGFSSGRINTSDFDALVSQWSSEFFRGGSLLKPFEFPRANSESWQKHYQAMVGGNLQAALSEFTSLKGQDDPSSQRRYKAAGDVFSSFVSGLSKWLIDFGYTSTRIGMTDRTPTSFVDAMERLEKAYQGATRFPDFQGRFFSPQDIIDLAGPGKKSTLDFDKYEQFKSLLSFNKGSFIPREVPAILERGEYVLNKDAVAAIGKLELDRLNRNYGRTPRLYHDGGYVTEDGSGRIPSGPRPVPVDPPSGFGGTQKVVLELSLVGENPDLTSWVRDRMVPVLNREISRGSVGG